MGITRKLSKEKKEQNDENKKGFTINQKWVFTIVSSILLLLIGYKIIFAEYLIDLTNFSFSEFLSLILAMFAISLSAMFYFKATESSSKFYNDTFKFTKNIAELLAKIESGFGVKLEHIHQSNANIRDMIEKKDTTIDNVKDKVVKGEKDFASKEINYKKGISELVEKLNLKDGEKKTLIKKLDNGQKEILKSKAELQKLQNELKIAQHSNITDNVLGNSTEFEQLRVKTAIGLFSNYLSNGATKTEAANMLLKKGFSSLLVKFVLDKHVVKIGEWSEPERL